MTNYQRIFGAGPRGLLFSAILLGLAGYSKARLGLPKIIDGEALRWIALILSMIGALVISGASFAVMSPNDRGKSLITSGVYRYVRHPLYASLISCFNFGLALFLNNWSFIIWAVVLHPLWHWNIKSEERLMASKFPDEYDGYCKITGRFLPRLRLFKR
ncbi:isoprenylcysteine carboxylmethyltransferase family protein [bacterium]|nr:isoprenylcysteine carboxylmethyltransferase family protein [bacterium]